MWSAANVVCSSGVEGEDDLLVPQASEPEDREKEQKRIK